LVAVVEAAALLLVVLAAQAGVAVHPTHRELLNRMSPEARALLVKVMLAVTASSQKAMLSGKAAVVVAQVGQGLQLLPQVAAAQVVLVLVTQSEQALLRHMLEAAVVVLSSMLLLPVVLVLEVTVLLVLPLLHQQVLRTQAQAVAAAHRTVRSQVLTVVQVS
jgi:hypothetical protein